MASEKKHAACCPAASKVSRSASVRYVQAFVLYDSNTITDLKTIAKFAQLEYKFGDLERGKTIFEGIVDSHPKRWDLWSIYIDMEAGQEDIASVRYVFCATHIHAPRLNNSRIETCLTEY